MKQVLIGIAFLLFCSTTVHAQTPIIIGPTTVLAWDACAPVSVVVTYTLSVDGTTQPGPLANVTCVAGTGTLPACSTTWQTCSVPASAIPGGSHSVTLTATSGGVTSLPSTPFAYVVLAIPVPQNVHFR